MTVKKGSFEVVSTVVMWTIPSVSSTCTLFLIFGRSRGERRLYIGAGFRRRDVSGTVTDRQFLDTKSVHFRSDILEAFHGDEQTHCTTFHSENFKN
jgi:hypothetical protein